LISSISAGASHVVAISGWNIAIVATTLGALARGIGRRRRSVLTGVAIAVVVGVYRRAGMVPAITVLAFVVLVVAADDLGVARDEQVQPVADLALLDDIVAGREVDLGAPLGDALQGIGRLHHGYRDVEKAQVILEALGVIHSHELRQLLGMNQALSMRIERL